MQSKLIGTKLEQDAAKFFMVLDPKGVQLEMFLGNDGTLAMARDGKWQGVAVPGKTSSEVYESSKASAAKNGGEVVEVVRS